MLLCAWGPDVKTKLHQLSLNHLVLWFPWWFWWQQEAMFPAAFGGTVLSIGFPSHKQHSIDATIVFWVIRHLGVFTWNTRSYLLLSCETQGLHWQNVKSQSDTHPRWPFHPVWPIQAHWRWPRWPFPWWWPLEWCRGRRRGSSSPQGWGDRTWPSAQDEWRVPS